MYNIVGLYLRNLHYCSILLHVNDILSRTYRVWLRKINTQKVNQHLNKSRENYPFLLKLIRR